MVSRTGLSTGISLEKRDRRGAYHLSKGTGWDEHGIMVRDFPKSGNQPNEMAFTI